MGELLAMIFGGGATGLLGTMFGRVMHYADKEQEHRFILEKYRLDGQMRAQEREYEERIAESAAFADALAASYAHDTSIGQGSQWVVNLLRLVRPVLTILLWVLVGGIWYHVAADMKTDTLPWLAGKTMQLVEQIIGTVLYCATAATLWWFGSRDMRKRQ